MYIITIPKSKVKSAQVLVVKWVKSSGSVSEGDVLCHVQAQQGVYEITSKVSGTLLKVLANEGMMISAAQPLAVIGQPRESLEPLEKYLNPQAEVKTAAEPTVDSATAETKTETPPAIESKGTEMTADDQPAVSAGDVVAIVMPQAGQSMEEGTIVAWKVAVGDRITEGQVIFEIETDKAVMEVEAVNSGRIAKITANEGDIVEVKLPVAYLAEEGVDVDAFIAAEGGSDSSASDNSSAQAKASGPVFTAEKKAVSVSDTGRVKASPAARKLAGELGVDLTAIDGGSGPNGRILSFDVENAEVSSGEAKRIPVSKMRRAIAKNLQYSKQNVPHFYVKASLDAQKLFDTYRQTKAEKFKCSLNDFVVLAVARAVKQYPEFRSQYNETEIVEVPSANIGIAVGTDNGLTVPVVLAADRMSLEQLAVRTMQVVESARAGKLEGVGQGVFTITNLGMFGTEEFSAIINPPESGILAVGAIREGVKVENGAIRPTRLMNMTLSADHRVVDGVVAAKFMQTLVQLLENPQELL